MHGHARAQICKSMRRALGSELADRVCIGPAGCFVVDVGREEFQQALVRGRRGREKCRKVSNASNTQTGRDAPLASET